MKVNQIVSEHKKGVRAMKYAKKTKGTVPVYGPDANDAKLKPVKPVKPTGTNEGVEIKPMPGASQVSVDGKPIATTDAATAQVISQAAEKGQFTATDGSTPPTSETGGDIGGDPTDDFIQDVEAEEGIFDAPTNPQIEALKAMLADPKYAGNPAWKAQLEKRLKIAQDRASIDGGMAMGQGGKPKEVLPPDAFSTANPNFKESRAADDELLGKMLVIAGLR